MMCLTLFWLFLAFCSTPSLPATTEMPTLFQSPEVIPLYQLNSTAKLKCSTTLSPTGLYLKQRYSKPRELLYLSIPDYTKTINYDFEHRLSVEGKCCDFTLYLSQLQTKDSDGYYCEWVIAEGEKLKITYRQANETVIIVRDGNPENECKKRMIHHVLFVISLGITITMFIICIGLLIWRFKQSYQRYSPHKDRHSHRRPLCPHHRT